MAAKCVTIDYISSLGIIYHPHLFPPPRGRGGDHLVTTPGAKIYWIVAGMLSELSAFINGALHRCAAMPLTKPATSDLG